MSDIRYVCLSDMHLGEEDSLLTNLKVASTTTDPKQASPVLEGLVKCLGKLISGNQGNKKPILVLCGDILEFALCTVNEAAMVFERFIELIMPKGNELFDEIVYIPGNHDHHLWESARETQYVNYISEKFKPGDELPIPWHTTNMFSEKEADRVPSYFLSRLIQRQPHLKDFKITVAYPNFGLFKKEKNRSVIFTHGHYTESLYTLVSQLKSLIFAHRNEPELIWDIEAENFAWIDFFWSTLGRSGEAGQDVELIYEKLHDKKQFEKMIDDLARNLAERYDLPGWGDTMERKLTGWALKKIINKFSKRERTKTGLALSEDSEKGLRKYVNGPLKKQILAEFKTEARMPSALTLVFGHTHKPFQRAMNFREFPYWVRVYNSGGWVVESVDPQPVHGGSIIVVDDDLQVAAINVYNDFGDPGEYSVKVEEAAVRNESPGSFYNGIRKSVEASRKSWDELSSIIAHTVRIRRENFIARIHEG